MLHFTAICLLTSFAFGQTPTVGLIEYSNQTYNGYTLFGGGPGLGGGQGGGNAAAYLIDNCGQLINAWSSQYNAGLSQYIDFDGNLIRPIRYGGNNSVGSNAGAGGGVEKLDWEGNQLWLYNANVNGQYMQHHDIEPLPNGNVLIIAWEGRSSSEAAALGRTGGGALTPEWIFEVEQDGATGGNIVWEWRVFDHTVQDVDPSLDNYGIVSEHPELFDINKGNTGNDWLHFNGIDYLEQYDLIIISSRFMNELFVIDHSTTTEEAASHEGGTYGKGGDFLYRWGNPYNYDQGTAADRTLLGQHGPRWKQSDFTQGTPMIAVFNNNNNGFGGGDSYVVGFEPPMNLDGSFNITLGSAYEPALPFFSEAVTGAPTGSNAAILPNSNFLYCVNNGGEIGEFTPEGELIWKYIIPTNSNGPVQQGGQSMSSSFIAERYEPDFIGFVGKDLTPQGPIELNPYDSECEIAEAVEPPISNFTVVIVQDSIAQFTDSSAGIIDEWMWDFGNGIGSNQQNPQFIFTESGDYEVCLTVTNNAGSNETCETVTINISVGINNDIFNDVNIYPQPASNYIYIESKKHNFINVTITDLSGKILIEKPFKNSIEIGHLKSGLYLIYISTVGNAVFTNKLLID